MSRLLRCTTFALAALLLSAGPALASSTTYRASGADATASFTVQEMKPCGTSMAMVQTFIGAQTFETALRVKGILTTTVQTLVQVSRFNSCDFSFSFDFGSFTGQPLQMSALNSATVAGHFVLESGTVVDLNLTITGTGTTSQGTSMQRENLGNVLIIRHSVGSSRPATVSGSATVDGTTFGTSQMLDQDAQLARHTGGEITILKP